VKTLTISDISEELCRRLAERAEANHRSIEDEALCCLRSAIESDDDALNAISDREWAQIEQSVCDTIHERGTPLTDTDFQRYREIARGRKGQ
jgi:plasmid stability protein